jgi:hypothetical protein
MQASKEPKDELTGWFAGRLPDDWFSGPPEITLDSEEIQVIGTVAEPKLEGEASDDARAAARESRIQQFREETRGARMRIANEAQRRFGRRVSWGAACGDERQLFTTLSLPVMTRLRLRERQLLDTLVDAGVARSRSEALMWCVRLVARNEEAWLNDLRAAFDQVEQVRAKGPIH